MFTYPSQDVFTEFAKKSVPEINPPYKGTLELPGEVYERLKALVTKRRSTIKDVVTEAVEHYLCGGAPLGQDPSQHPAIQKLLKRPELLEALLAADDYELGKVEGILRGRAEARGETPPKKRK